MKNPIETRPEMQELKREIPFWSPPHDEANMSIEDPDTKLSMIVLLLTCLALAAMAHVFV